MSDHEVGNVRVRAARLAHGRHARVDLRVEGPIPRLEGAPQRFERVGGGNRSGIPGIGLGLHVTRGLIEAHGGTIEVQGVPGKDTTFRFTLPCARLGGGR